MSNNTSLINRTRTKRKCLMIANELYDKLDTGPSVRTDADGKTWTYTRAREARARGKFTQVSQELLDELDVEFRRLVYERVSKQMQTGRTVR